jgi:DNA-binding GntR family transcriptional regulator
LYLTHGIKRASKEHHQLLDLCRNRDIPVTGKLLREHIQHAGQSLKEALYERRTLAEKASGKN